jgi:hypothetical protein
MITFDPPISTCLLSAVAPGSIIRVRDEIGFCAFNPSDPQRTRMLVSLRAADSPSFHYSVPGAHETVLSFGQDLILRPNFETYDGELVRSEDSKAELFMVDGDPKIIVHLPRPDRAVRLLDLKSGELSSLTGVRAATGFLEWSAGISTKRGRFHPLIFVGGRPDSNSE